MVAEGWQKWWKTFEQHAQTVNERLVELAEIKQGDKVLDIATGIGEPAITAARKVGINGHVLATDISPQMLRLQNKDLYLLDYKILQNSRKLMLKEQILICNHYYNCHLLMQFYVVGG